MVLEGIKNVDNFRWKMFKFTEDKIIIFALLLFFFFPSFLQSNHKENITDVFIRDWACGHWPCS